MTKENEQLIMERLTIPELLNLRHGTNDCPACGGRGKLSVYPHYMKCWRTSCELNAGMGLVNAWRWHTKLDYAGAMQQLEARAGIRQAREVMDARSIVLESALEAYHYYLDTTPAAQDYILRRGWSLDLARSIGIGYAPPGGLRQFDIDHEALAREGLIKEDGEDYYRERIIFPIRDTRGHLVHMVGRYIGSSEGTPRYKDTRAAINSKRYLYLEHCLKEYSKHPARELYIVEGPPDATSLIGRGLPVVGLLGLEYLLCHTSKFKPFRRITFIFDSDKYSDDHPTHAGVYKSWVRIIPQLVQLQVNLPLAELMTYMVADYKDINEWLVAEPRVNAADTINANRILFVDDLLAQWGPDISHHVDILRVLTATHSPLGLLAPYVDNQLGPLEYASLLFGS